MARIVIMEDEASTRRLITGVLKKVGHEVSDFDNGAEGLLTVLAELPDLVVSDVEMPKINGFEVLSDIRNAPETAHTPVILLTSRSSQEDIRHGLAQGANEYLTKPFDPTTLLAAVERQLLAKHQGGASDEADSAFEATRPADLVFPSLGAPQTPDLQLVAMAHQEEPEPIASRHLGQAWAVSMQVHDEQLLRDALGAKLWRSVLRQLFLPVSKDIALRRADFLDLSESRLVLFFLHQDHAADSGQVPSHVRAAQAVQAMLRAGVQAKAWLAHNLPDQPAGQVPMLRLFTSLHKGPIDVIRVPLDFGGERDKVVGPTAQFMHQLRDGEPRVMWRVLGTQAAVAASSNTYKLGAQMDISVGAQEVRVHALQAMNPAFNAGEALDASAWI